MHRDPARDAVPLDVPVPQPLGGACQVWAALVRLFDRLNGTAVIHTDIAASDYDDVQKITDT